MKDVLRVYIFVEGQTEETFVKEVIYNYLFNLNICIIPILLNTSSTGKGGIPVYQKVKRDLERMCLNKKDAYITTMFDFFRLPTSFPGIVDLNNISDPYQKVDYIENSLAKTINCKNFIPYISLHEFEALLYSDPSKFGEWFNEKSVVMLMKEKQQFETPEHINNGPETAPSKRILKLCISYEKPLHGPLIAASIGLDLIRSQCKHFAKWLEKLEKLKP